MTAVKVSKPRGLSCQRCRARKIKCDGNLPCTSCTKENTECVRVSFDRRRDRIPSKLIDQLNNKIEYLESKLSKIGKLVNDNDDLPVIIDSRDSSELPGVYGPTSIFESTTTQLSNHDSEIKRLNNDPIILACVKSFFIWQYPDHNMFIYREAFLADFLNPKSGCKYCSIELIYAICCLGSSMSSNYKLKSKSFYEKAKSLLISKLDHSSIPSIQALLCLSFYEISHGNNSNGWMLCGIAIRMGYDIGFQLNPSSWYLNENITQLDCLIRSRVYWGVYIADHFISLLMGRPSSLKVSQTSIPESQELPDLEGIQEFSYISPGENVKKIVYISAPLNSIIQLIQISELMINDIFTRITDKEEIIKFITNSNKLEYYNLKIKNWKNELPNDLKWDQTKLRQTADNPTNMSLRYYYYVVLLCLNRPFIEMKTASTVSPMRICEEIIKDLVISIEKFRQVHGLEKGTIYIVYCCILSISILMLINENDEMINRFLCYLEECSSTWKLAEKSYNMIKMKLRNRYQSDIVDSLDYFAGPPMMMTAELLNDDWEVLFPEYKHH